MSKMVREIYIEVREEAWEILGTFVQIFCGNPDCIIWVFIIWPMFMIGIVDTDQCL